MGKKSLKASELIARYREGTCSEEEKELIEAWLASLPEHPLDVTEEEMLEDFLTGYYRLDRSLTKAKISKLRYWFVAATILFLLVAGFFVYQLIPNREIVPVQVAQQDVAPGGNHAVLTLADGRQITLDEAVNGQLAEESGILITKTADGEIIYEIRDIDRSGQGSEESYNLIETPRGGQYKVILPDSSCVWLNAASSLRYPTHFAGHERRVELKGEAYFEIKSRANRSIDGVRTSQVRGGTRRRETMEGKTPFIVQTASQEVEVLGTHFNVNAYVDEPFVRTTLLQGSVEVTALTTKVARVLQPGQQSMLEGDRLEVINVDTETATAWKDGLMVLDHADLATVIRQIERWYDVEFDIVDMPDSVSLNGELPRDIRLSGILKALELNTGMRFAMEERRVMVQR